MAEIKSKTKLLWLRTLPKDCREIIWSPTIKVTSKCVKVKDFVFLWKSFELNNIPFVLEWLINETKGSFHSKKRRNIWNFPNVGWPPLPTYGKSIVIFYCLKMIYDSFWDFSFFPLKIPKILLKNSAKRVVVEGGGRS